MMISLSNPHDHILLYRFNSMFETLDTRLDVMQHRFENADSRLDQTSQILTHIFNACNKKATTTSATDTPIQGPITSSVSREAAQCHLFGDIDRQTEKPNRWGVNDRISCSHTPQSAHAPVPVTSSDNPHGDHTAGPVGALP